MAHAVNRPKPFSGESIRRYEEGVDEPGNAARAALAKVFGKSEQYIEFGDAEANPSADARPHPLQIRLEEAEALKRLRDGNQDWRRYVLGLAMVERSQQELLLTTMRQAVPDYKVEKAFGEAPHVRARRVPAFSTREGNKSQQAGDKDKKRTRG